MKQYTEEQILNACDYAGHDEATAEHLIKCLEILYEAANVMPEII